MRITRLWCEIKSLKKIVLWLAVLPAIGLTGCMPKDIEETESLADALYQQQVIQSDHIMVKRARLHYTVREQLEFNAGALTANEVTELLVFVHGTPGDWRSFGQQLADRRLATQAVLVAVDRPSWGGSFFEKERVETSLGEQAGLIAPLLLHLREDYPNARLTLVGHSFGASLVPMIAMVYPQAVDSVVVIAGDLSAEYLEEKWYNTVLAWPWVRPLLPREICYANDEVLALDENIAAMSDYWSHLSVPMMVIQGNEDTLVDPRNADFAAALKTPAGVRVERIDGGSHLIHMVQPQRVDGLLLDWLASNFTTANSAVKKND
ncbi:alpha/beta fold hydrolase [Teredinibacter turnerae]|uniref:alpha/beta fold hydrolase n=1 Tax=Teredinibacter turnerae TaxID=2426 RepID=UPI00035E2E21|nr:alpha/beta hydrolase [Teredinibacter turnerae]